MPALDLVADRRLADARLTLGIVLVLEKDSSLFCVEWVKQSRPSGYCWSKPGANLFDPQKHLPPEKLKERKNNTYRIVAPQCGMWILQTTGPGVESGISEAG
jgi:hypothetical protein